MAAFSMSSLSCPTFWWDIDCLPWDQPHLTINLYNAHRHVSDMESEGGTATILDKRSHQSLSYLCRPFPMVLIALIFVSKLAPNRIYDSFNKSLAELVVVYLGLCAMVYSCTSPPVQSKGLSPPSSLRSRRSLLESWARNRSHPVQRGERSSEVISKLVSDRTVEYGHKGSAIQWSLHQD